MAVNLVEEVAKNVVRALRHETIVDAETEPQAQETSAVPSLLHQLTEQVIVELTKLLIERSRRLRPEEASAAEAVVVRKMTNEVLAKITMSVEAPSSDEVRRRLHDVKILLQDTEVLLRAKKTQQALACISQCRSLIS